MECQNQINIFGIIQNSKSLWQYMANICVKPFNIFHSGCSPLSVTCKLIPHPCLLCPDLWRRLLKTVTNYYPSCRIINHHHPQQLHDELTEWDYLSWSSSSSSSTSTSTSTQHEPDGVRLSELIVCFAAWRWCFVTSQWLACSSLDLAGTEISILIQSNVHRFDLRSPFDWFEVITLIISIIEILVWSWY